MRNPCLEIAREELEAAGVRNIEYVHSGKHPQLRWRVNGGALRVYTIPATPSDWRAARNTRAGIRRILRADGVSTLPDRIEEVEPPPRKLDRIAELERRVADLERRLNELT